MGRAMELICTEVTAPGATIGAAATVLVAHAGNSLTVRNHPPESPAHLIQAWADNQSDGTLRIRSPFLHDQVQGIRLDIEAGVVQPLLPKGALTRLYPQDTLVLDLTGSATAGDIEQAAMLLYYEDLPGINARLASPADILPRIETVVTVENTIAVGTTGDYSGEEALDAEFDLLRANRDYAVLGYTSDTEHLAVRYRGSDIGNLGVGGPSEPDIRHVTKDWFVRLSEDTGLPCIPVVNAANKSSLLIDASGDENGVDPTITTILGQLAAA